LDQHKQRCPYAGRGKAVIAEAKAIVASDAAASKVAATALLTAIEMLEDHPLLRIDHEVRLPLLTPFNSSTPKEIEEEVERRLEEGFRTFKIKVGTMRMRISSVSGLSSGPSPVAQLCE
jgi:L-alanine-DL-glutamate epimerase-like enolase superfamily enzyme